MVTAGLKFQAVKIKCNFDLLSCILSKIDDENLTLSNQTAHLRKLGVLCHFHMGYMILLSLMCVTSLDVTRV